MMENSDVIKTKIHIRCVTTNRGWAVRHPAGHAHILLAFFYYGPELGVTRKRLSVTAGMKDQLLLGPISRRQSLGKPDVMVTWPRYRCFVCREIDIQLPKHVGALRFRKCSA